MKSVCVLTFGNSRPRYLPMFEIFLASDLKRRGCNHVEVLTIFGCDNSQRWIEYLMDLPQETGILFWETKSAKSFGYIMDYFGFAKIARQSLSQPLVAGGYWASIASEHFPEEFESFDTVLKGFEISKIGQVLSSADPDRLPREVDVHGQTDWNQYSLELEVLKSPKDYVMRGHLAGYQTTFACPNNCYFCYNNSLKEIGVEYNERSMERLKDDLERIQKIYRLRSLQLKDMNFFYNKKRAFDFMELVYDRGLKLGSNVDITVSDVDEVIFKQFRRYGFGSLFFGLESFFQQTLRRFNKTYTFDRLIKGFELADKYKTFLTGSVLIGLPWQSPSDVEEEIKIAVHVMNTFRYVQIGFNPVRPIIGTKLQEKYFPNVLDGKSLAEYVDIMAFRVWRMQENIYGRRFNFVNMEKLHNTMLAVKFIRRAEVEYPNIFYQRFLPQLRKLLESHAQAFARQGKALNRVLKQEVLRTGLRGLTLLGRIMRLVSRGSKDVVGRLESEQL